MPGTEVGPQNQQWVEMVQGNARKVLEHPEEFIISPVLQEIYSLNPESLPIQAIIEIIPHIEKLQVFSYQGTASHFTPSKNGFRVKSGSYGENHNKPDFLQSPQHTDDLMKGWNNWFIGKFKSTNHDLDTDALHLQEKILSGSLLLIASIPEKKLMILMMPTYDALDGNRPHSTVMIACFDEIKSMHELALSLKTSGDRGLIALTGSILHPAISPEITNFNDEKLKDSQRKFIFAPRPKTNALQLETTFEFGSPEIQQSSATGTVNIFFRAKEEKRAREKAK